MILDRLETLAAITFLESVIPKAAETGKNCLFVRVDGENLIFTGGANFVTKKVVMVRPNTVEEAGRTEKGKTHLEKFMIPIADLLAFKKMMQEHKAHCKKLAKNDPSYLFVEMSDTELVSYDGRIVYEQPKYDFKDLESIFQITKEHVSEIPMISADVIATMKGFSKSTPVGMTFTGPKGIVHLEQGDYEAVVLPPVEKQEGEEQGTGDGQTTIDE